VQKETKQHLRLASVLGPPVLPDVASRKTRKPQGQGKGNMEEDKEIAPQWFTRSSQA